MRLFGLAVLMGLVSVAGWGTTLYSNGPISGAIGSSIINGGTEVTDSFILSSAATVTGISNIGIWVYTPDTPSTVDWIISTAPDGGGIVEASGAGAALSSSFLENVSTLSVYNSSFSTGSVSLSAGTYYLELLNATSAQGGAVFWDVNLGPSTATSNGSPISSESFEVDGGAIGPVPEPTSVMLSGIGLAALAGMWLLRRPQFQR